MRPTAFQLGGAALLAVTVLSAFSWLVPSTTELDLDVAGGVAIGLGWAAYGRSTLAGAAKAAVASVALIALFMGSLALLFALDWPIDLFIPNAVPELPGGEGRSLLSDVAAFGGFLAMLAGIVAAVAAPFGAAARAYAAMPRSRALRLIPGAIALVPSLTLAFVASTDGYGVAVASTLWLGWALRRARDAGVGRGGGRAAPGAAAPQAPAASSATTA